LVRAISLVIHDFYMSSHFRDTTLASGTLEVYREPNFTGYSSTQILNPGDQASPFHFPDATIDVAELLAL